MSQNITSLNPINPTVDFDADGIQHGHLRLPYSRNDSAWGHVMVPISVAKNGNGPTALLTGGNHGDEYEGPLALLELAHSLTVEQINGRIIMLPALNTPAFHAGTRLSPVDGKNMNRIFPGSPDGTVSDKIADYVTNTLLPMADYVLDFHSGGKTLDFVPFAAIHETNDAVQTQKALAAMQAFGAPWSMIMQEIDAIGMYDTTAEQLGKVFVTTELRGGGTSTAASTAIARRGVRNFLRHAGILSGDIEKTASKAMAMPDGCFAFADCCGVLDMEIDLNQPVEQGQILAKIWPTDRTGADPATIAAPISGILAARHFPGLIQQGDCVAVIATEV